MFSLINSSEDFSMKIRQRKYLDLYFLKVTAKLTFIHNIYFFWLFSLECILSFLMETILLPFFPES